MIPISQRRKLRLKGDVMIRSRCQGAQSGVEFKPQLTIRVTQETLVKGLGTQQREVRVCDEKVE